MVTRGLWTVVAAFGAWALVRVTGLDRGFPVIQLIAFTPYVAAATVPVALGALALRRWRPAAAGGLVALTLLACVLPRALPGDAGPSSGAPLRVLTSNLRFGGADTDALVRLVRAERIDLVALQEYTPEARDRLAAAGLADLLPYTSIHPLDGPFGSALYSRYPLHDDGARTHGSGFAQARGELAVPGTRPVAVESVHPCAPAEPGSSSCWRHDLADQPDATPHGEVRLLLGDFNATLDHAPLRHLIGTGYRDAADSTGSGLDWSWPHGKTFPKVTIDHVLVDRRIGVRGYRVHNLSNTDHRPLVAELVLPR
jgi:endonuclease/exonuclease/phosphatase (EEP) superfamily protein YafD